VTKVVVLGASGYIGQAIARACEQAGFQVTGIIRNTVRPGLPPGIDWRIGDASDIATVVDLATDADAVIDAAKLPFDSINHYAILMAALRGTDTAYLFTSGTGVLSSPTPDGESHDRVVSDLETVDGSTAPASLRPRVEVEQIIRGAADQVRALVVRPPMVWGRGGSNQIPALFESVRRNGSACYVGSGLNSYSHVHVDDLADVYVRAVTRGRAGATYHAVAGEENWLTIAGAVATTAGGSARSITMHEATDLWGPQRAELYFGVSSRSSCPRTLADLRWRPRHTDILLDITHGSYRNQSHLA